MWQAFLLIHILGAVMMGFYAIAPFMTGKLKTSSPAVQEGVLSTMTQANRIGQIMLIVQLFTGGYLMSVGDKYSVLWMMLITVIFLLVGAFSGMMGSAIQKGLTAAKGNRTDDAALDKVKLFSSLAFVSYIVIIVLMVYNQI